ncbi:MAG: cadherin-like beta sandwich domain-containing protein [Bacilli bacterium]|nr:cadherin-like beta sandwich domain-containing protein [Bacilli bacterium]
MKKINAYLLSLVIVLSCVLPFIPTNVKAMASTYTYAYIDATELGPRTCPSTNCGRVYHDEGGIIWLYRPRVVEVIGYSGSWAQIKWNYWGFTYTGYILQEYLGNKRTVTLDQNYANELRRKGFPESYVESLTKMHAIHPKWNFEVSNTNVKLTDAVNAEYNPVYKNLISTTNKNQLSTDGAAYVNGRYVEFEPGWYAPNKETIKYYMDPRNFLDDNSVFMFEQLSYNQNVSESDIQSMLNGTFMAGSFSYNGQTYTYARAFMEAGKSTNVNPVHLAARVLQEQGTNGSATSSMNYGGQTYYNYFNFNASGSTTSEIVNNALSYARSHGWNNPYLAIKGGAEGISDGYISNNQDTLYYQKFNIVGSSRYWHQYMANIQAPYKESYTTYSSYFNKNLLNNSYTFKIPVYSDMGGGSAIATKSNNNNLNGLSISNVSLNPAFSSSITTYNATVDYNVSSVNVSATKADSKASVSGTGTVKLNVGSNTIKVNVTAEDGSVKTYTVTITRKEEEKIDPSAAKPDDTIRLVGYKNNGGNISGFDLGQDVSKVVSKIKSKFSTASIKVINSNNKEITSGLVSTGQKITVTINNNTKTYNVVVFGDTNGDGKISAIDYSKVKAQILKTASLNGSYSLAADTNKDGKVSAIDYSKIKSHILKIDSLVQ